MLIGVNIPQKRVSAKARSHQAKRRALKRPQGWGEKVVRYLAMIANIAFVQAPDFRS
jgi:hypothetical protein